MRRHMHDTEQTTVIEADSLQTTREDEVFREATESSTPNDGPILVAEPGADPAGGAPRGPNRVLAELRGLFGSLKTNRTQYLLETGGNLNRSAFPLPQNHNPRR